MNPVSSVSSAFGASDFGVAVLKKLLDTGTSTAQALISQCLDPRVGQHLDLRL